MEISSSGTGRVATTLMGTANLARPSSKRQKMPKTGKMTFFDVFQELHENVCGAMWRYVALCGAMWRYVALCGAIQNGKK